MKKINKKVLLSLSVLATPFVVENLVEANVASANAQYNLTQKVKVYGTAQSAAKQGNTNRTYESGTYYIYKEHNGMINISRTKGKPGSWINPATNKPVEVKNSVQNTVSSSKEQSVVKSTSQKSSPVQKQTNTYVLNNDVKVYNNAVSAKSQKGSKSTYKSGNYFIFKEFNGMINISRVSGRAGAWINPEDNKAIIAKTNLTTTQQKPTKVKSTSTKTTTETTSTNNNNNSPKTINNGVVQTEGTTYVLKNRTSVYNNAVDAKNSKNSTTDYNQGTYYVYKTYNGMINISRTRGKAGAWINPNEKASTGNVVTVLPFESKTYRITSPYAVARTISSIGLRDVHKGVDFVTGNNKEAILSTEDGVVVGAGLSPFGDGAQYVTIKHAENSFTSYWHLANNSITVRKGDTVKAGQKIGTIGTTGWSTGIHLHFMHATTENVYVSHQDPMKYLRSLSDKNKTN